MIIVIFHFRNNFSILPTLLIQSGFHLSQFINALCSHIRVFFWLVVHSHHSPTLIFKDRHFLLTSPVASCASASPSPFAAREVREAGSNVQLPMTGNFLF